MTQTRDTQEHSSSLQRRLAAYSTLVVAGACAAAAAPTAEAGIIYSGTLNNTVTASAIGSYFNLTTFAFGASYGVVNGGDATAPVLNLWGTSGPFAYLYPSSTTINRFVANGTGATLELSTGTVVDSTSVYGTTRTGPTGGIVTNGGWIGGTTGYFGIKFLNGATTEYGWVLAFVPTTPSTATPIKILGAAYENTGAGIVVGAVPEPGTVSFLALGAVGVGALGWRRRKAA